jgi:Sec-independent protein secretion pathway component TatC
MKQPAKILLGLLTLAPAAFFVLFVTTIVGIMSTMTSASSMRPESVIEQMRSLLLPGMITSLLGILLIVFYFVDVNKNEQLDKNGRLVWMILFIVAGVITMPAYFILYLHPWKQDAPKQDTPSAPA